VVVEVADGDVWHVCRGEPTWLAECYRIKPRTIRIGEIDVPEPVRVALMNGDIYYYPSNTNGVMSATWWGDTSDRNRLQHNMIHLTKEAAELHAEALILVSGGRVE
jgi:hypothetical protein